MGRGKGTVVTFYSYKGGTGRTMALANVAALLTMARYGENAVLMIDWDLEAPGLHSFFPLPSGAPPTPPGLIDFFVEVDARIPGEGIGEDAAGTLVDDLVERYVLETQVPRLHVMRAGRFDDGYAARTATFGWESLHRRAPALFLGLAEALARRYQYVLIDSRTGYTDTSGICTMLMPEKLVAVFTPNRQSLDGVLEIVRHATRYRRESADLRPLTVFPLAARVEAAEPELRQAWRYGNPERGILGFQPRFEEALKEAYGLQECSLEAYFDEVQIQHAPRYAYGEEVAVLSATEGDRLSLARSYESFADRLVGTAAPWEKPGAAGDGRGGTPVARLGRYEILETIGQGAMGVVYKARDPLSNRTLALKTLSPALDLDAAARQRFQREAQVLMRLHHRNILMVHDVGEEAGQTYIAMELLDGQDLRTRMQERAFIPLDEKVRIMIGVCSGLAHVHRHGVVHGDLKPKNVFLARSGAVKLLDFGLARVTTSGVTQTGLVLGTLEYMSPEQVRGDVVDTRSDIFSAGAMFYELLTGKRPFRGESFTGILFNIIEHDPEPIEQHDPAVPAGLSAAVMRALAKDLQERYQTADEMLADLEAVAASL